MENSTKDNAATLMEPVNTENRIAGVITPDAPVQSAPSAFESLTEELANSPSDYIPAKALQALQANEFEKALKLCETALNDSASEKTAAPLSLTLIKGKSLLALKRPEQAAEEFHRILSEAPESPAALKGLGDTYFQQNKEIIAFTYYERARELCGDYSAIVDGVSYTLKISDEFISTPAHNQEFAQAVSQAPTVKLEEMLEEIVVRDSETTPQVEKAETPPAKASVSLTIKRNSEESTTVLEPATEIVEEIVEETVEEAVEETVEEAVVEPTTKSENQTPKIKESTKSKTKPVELTERYDRPSRPVHYQTETMADQLMQQGYPDAALDIYRVLVEKNPIARLQEKLAKAESRQKRPR